MGISDRVPSSYQGALTALGKRDVRSLGCNTQLEREYGAVALRLYSTVIVRFYADNSVSVYTGGYATRTTQDRITAALRGSGWGVGAIRGEWQWFYRGRHVCKFEDSDRVYLAPGVEGCAGIFQDYPRPGDRCGHSACRQNFCDTGSLWCVEPDAREVA